MGLADAFKEEDRVQVRFSDFYRLMRESVKAEFLMNGVRCKVPHEQIYEMATGEKATGKETPVEEQKEAEK